MGVDFSALRSLRIRLGTRGLPPTSTNGSSTSKSVGAVPAPTRCPGSAVKIAGESNNADVRLLLLLLSQFSLAIQLALLLLLLLLRRGSESSCRMVDRDRFKVAASLICDLRRGRGLAETKLAEFSTSLSELALIPPFPIPFTGRCSPGKLPHLFAMAAPSAPDARAAGGGMMHFLKSLYATCPAPALGGLMDNNCSLHRERELWLIHKGDTGTLSSLSDFNSFSGFPAEEEIAATTLGRVLFRPEPSP